MTLKGKHQPQPRMILGRLDLSSSYHASGPVYIAAMSPGRLGEIGLPDICLQHDNIFFAMELGHRDYFSGIGAVNHRRLSMQPASLIPKHQGQTSCGSLDKAQERIVPCMLL